MWEQKNLPVKGACLEVIKKYYADFLTLWLKFLCSQIEINAYNNSNLIYEFNEEFEYV